MKKILIYTINNGQFIDSLYDSLGAGFKQIGREVIFFNVAGNNASQELKRIIENEDIDFSIGHNEFGIINTEKYVWLNDFYKDKFHMAILDDAPYNTVTKKVADIYCPHLLVAYRDRSHLNFLQAMKFKSPVSCFVFLPFGAIIEPGQIDNANKDIDIIFSGMYYGEAKRVWHNINLDDDLKNLLDNAADILVNNAISVEKVFTSLESAYNDIEIDRNIFYPLYVQLYQYAKCHRRNTIIKTMAESGMNLTVCSDTWKKSPYAKNLIIKAANNTHEVLSLYSRSKILLQDMAEFNDGSHCRVGDGTLCKAMIISEYSKYLDENFTKNDILLFKWNSADSIPNLCNLALKNERLRTSFVNNAMQKVCNRHLPRHSAATILETVKIAKQKNNM